MGRPILVGAVIYEPKVAVIWETIKEFFASEGCPMDCVFYSNYELQVTALLEGHIHIAWNSPLAWVDAQRRTGGRCRAIAMRDTDRDRVTRIVVRKDAGLRSLEDLRARVVATGASDSPQATLIPLQLLRRHGLLGGRDLQVRRFDVLVGKHGDHIGGERDALECLKRGEAHAACVLDLNWEGWTADGTADPAQLTVLATTPPRPLLHRRRAPPEEQGRQTEVLFGCPIPAHREMMDLEGLGPGCPDAPRATTSSPRAGPAVLRAGAQRTRRSFRDRGGWPALRDAAGARGSAGSSPRRSSTGSPCGGAGGPSRAGGRRLRHRDGRRAASRQLLFLRGREIDGVTSCPRPRCRRGRDKEASVGSSTAGRPAFSISNPTCVGRMGAASRWR
jgi:ABC-type phosphate/phosphonate transport system substrate-binding protein